MRGRVGEAVAGRAVQLQRTVELQRGVGAVDACSHQVAQATATRGNGRVAVKGVLMAGCTLVCAGRMRVGQGAVWGHYQGA